MVAVGIVLLVLAVVLAVGVALDNGGSAEVSVFGQDVSGLTQSTLFLAGVATGFVIALALGLVLAGLKRRRAKALAHQRQVHAARSDAETLAQENARLQDQLARRQAASTADADLRPEESGAHARDSARHGSGHTAES